ncbi:MAG: VWA domain-containing protein [Verrucomicrobiota bacterium]|nr:VWA domain-containing protein [Verrucomicrobiota bacterium]MDG1889987.1 VWA domain-containing protein [Verrucomicrobiota bacterium]
MTFAHPWYLSFLVVPLLLLTWEWRRSGKRVVMPFDHFGIKGGRFWGVAIQCGQSLSPMLLALAIILLAGPQQLSAPQSKRSLTNIQFCVDVSGSMTAAFGNGDRYDAAMKSINQFIDYREGDSFGLTFFGSHFLHWVPLTDDTTAIRYAPPFFGPKRLPRWFGGGTRIGMALQECLKVMADRDEGDRMIILISDGMSSDLGNGNEEKVARKLRDAEVVLYGIHIGSGAAPDQVVNIAGRTGGEVFETGDPEGLNVIFRRIDAMQEARIEKTSAETMDHFAPFCYAGLALMALKLTSLFGLRYTPW